MSKQRISTCTYIIKYVSEKGKKIDGI